MEDSKDTQIEDGYPAVLTDLSKVIIKDVAKQPLKEGQVRVKVFSAPVHPFDLELSTGGIMSKNDFPELPIGLGYEGAGEVIEIGPNADETLKGKRVAFTQAPGIPNYEGAFRKYVSVDPSRMVVFSNDANYDQIACAKANPLTISCMIDYCQRNNHTSIVNDAASSSCGKILVKACKKFGIHLINLIRKDDQIQVLKDLGANEVFNYTSDDFAENFSEACKTHKPTVYFTAISGKVASENFSKMPHHSKLIAYGSLSNENIDYDPRNLIFKSQSIEGFTIMNWLQLLSKEELDKMIDTIAEDIANGGKVYGTEIGKIFKLSEIEDAFTNAKTNASSGKTIIRPQE